MRRPGGVTRTGVEFPGEAAVTAPLRPSVASITRGRVVGDSFFVTRIRLVPGGVSPPVRLCPSLRAIPFQKGVELMTP